MAQHDLHSAYTSTSLKFSTTYITINRGSLSEIWLMPQKWCVDTGLLSSPTAPSPSVSMSPPSTYTAYRQTRFKPLFLFTTIHHLRCFHPPKRTTKAYLSILTMTNPLRVQPALAERLASSAPTTTGGT